MTNDNVEAGVKSRYSSYSTKIKWIQCDGAVDARSHFGIIFAEPKPSDMLLPHRRFDLRPLYSKNTNLKNKNEFIYKFKN
jgi:hypothetical protein